MAAYVDTLKLEIDRIASLLPDGVKVARMHWGGGTPTILSASQIRGLKSDLNRAFEWSDDLSFSVEIDPNEIDDHRLEALAETGMTRASIGVQDFNPSIQRIIGRLQSYEVTRAAVEGLRDYDITSLNADILYGLPEQSPERIADSVQMLLSLLPDRVALYGYAHVPWIARRQVMIPTETLPLPEERLTLFETARDQFLWDGYEEIGIDHFALPQDGLAKAAHEGRLRRNFQGYTDDDCPVLIGLGASAISRFPQGYAQNQASTADYAKAVRGGRLATARGHVMSEDDLLRARLIEALMCDRSIETAEMTERFDVSQATLMRLYRKAAKAFPEMVHWDSEGFVIRDDARPLTRMIAQVFDQYDMRPEGHSSAI